MKPLFACLCLCLAWLPLLAQAQPSTPPPTSVADAALAPSWGPMNTACAITCW